MAEIRKVLKNNTEHYKTLINVHDYLREKNIELITTVNSGIIYKLNNKYYKYSEEGQYSEVVPPYFDGRFILCDENGHTDFYQED